MATKGGVTVVVGGQYGSEGKGNIVSHMANDFDIHVRTGGPNAGHSHQVMGKVYKQQVIPVGWSNPDAQIVIGRGALVPLGQLVKELVDIYQDDHTIVNRLFIDEDACELNDTHHEEEGGTSGKLHKRIGSTGEGVGAARQARMSRDRDRIAKMGDASVAGHLQEMLDMQGVHIPVDKLLYRNTPALLARSVKNGSNVLVEGTQGSGLSLIHGPWPYVTSADTNAAGFLSEAGISPMLVDNVVLVIRTYPIRVAGNSGPLSRETTWPTISQKLGKPVVEKTTVTELVRRVGEWDEVLVRKAVEINQPTAIALNFADYLNPADEGLTDWDALSDTSKQFVSYLEATFGVPVQYIGTGGDTWNVVDRG